MTQFIQLHFLTAYPPANLNRDDTGKPKTAVMGGINRLRISSQSLKRAWRSSELFETALAGYKGTRTKRMGIEIYHKLLNKGIAEKDAKLWAQTIAKQFGKLKKADKTKPLADIEIEQLAHFSPEEIQAIDQLIEQLVETKSMPSDTELELLRKEHKAADIACFGRMLADKSNYNVEAAIQVAHAITTHRVEIEDDYFTAVDDLNSGEEDRGAGHIGETGFAAGLFYGYVCINRDLLKENLQHDEELTQKTLAALTEAIAKIAPTGKQNSFASRAYASYMLAEKGTQPPRSLAVAFLQDLQANSSLAGSVARLESTRKNMDEVFGSCSDAEYFFNVESGEGSLQALLDFIKKE